MMQLLFEFLIVAHSRTPDEWKTKAGERLGDLARRLLEIGNGRGCLVGA